MNINDNILSDQEKQWVAYLNGEEDPKNGNDLDAKQKSEFAELWQAAGTCYSFSAADPDKGWDQLQKKLGHTEPHRKFTLFGNTFLKYAATVVMVMGIGYAAYRIYNAPGKNDMTPVALAFAETGAHPVNVTVITLPDGTTVKLNANTRIEYPQHFSAGTREVRLSGEAFFEVTKDTLHPFRIETINAAVEVLGTSFNVSAYPGAERVEVNVETGDRKSTRLNSSH